jgi:hypothetical protein
MKLDDKVMLGWLYGRTGQKGNRHLSGCLGAAQIMLFKNDHADDDNAWGSSSRTAPIGPRRAPRRAKAGKRISGPKRSRRPPAGRNASSPRPSCPSMTLC